MRLACAQNQICICTAVSTKMKLRRSKTGNDPFMTSKRSYFYSLAVSWICKISQPSEFKRLQTIVECRKIKIVR